MHTDNVTPFAPRHETLQFLVTTFIARLIDGEGPVAAGLLARITTQPATTAEELRHKFAAAAALTLATSNYDDPLNALLRSAVAEWRGALGDD